MTIHRDPTITEQCEWQRAMDERVERAMAESARQDRIKSIWIAIAWVIGMILLVPVMWIVIEIFHG